MTLATGISVVLKDLAVPIHAPVSVAFADTNMEINAISGTVMISRANDESDVTHYAVYLNRRTSNPANTVSELLKLIPKTGQDIQFKITDRQIQSDQYTAFVEVYSQNESGAMKTGEVISVKDVGRPSQVSALAGFVFNDTDSRLGFVAGTVSITAAPSNEYSDLVYYWGSDCKTALVGMPSVGATTQGKSGFEVSFGTILPAGAKYLLVARRNGSLESLDFNCAYINDGQNSPRSAPSSIRTSFTNTADPLNNLDTTLSPTIWVGAPAIMEDITHYVIYWANSDGTLANATPVATMPSGGTRVILDWYSKQQPKSDYFKVFSKNRYGTSATGPLVKRNKEFWTCSHEYFCPGVPLN
jgi:hypothetical protein